jgi:HK97 family phage prohead protease
MMSMREAAAERARGGVRQRADRPSQRRSAEHPGGRAAARATLTEVRLRAAGVGAAEVLEFAGHASVTERGYEMWDAFGPYMEVVSAAAFDDTLARADLDVPLVLGHNQLRRIARTTNGTLDLAMDDEGLAVVARLDPADVDVAYIVPKLRSGLVDEMSFAFRIELGTWSPDYTEFRIDRANIHRGDVAIVGYGANPHTDGGTRSPRPDTARARALLALAIAG